VVISKFFILSELRQFSAEQRAALAAGGLEPSRRANWHAVMGPYVWSL
jgi:hypothetical protein